MVKCWDLEANKVIRHYHGHLSGVYSLSLHPTLDVLVTAGRDATARVSTKRRVVIFGLTPRLTQGICFIRFGTCEQKPIYSRYPDIRRPWLTSSVKTLTHKL